MGSVIRPHGLAGEVLVFLHTDSASRFRPQAVVISDARPLTVASSRASENGLLVRFEGITDRNAAEALGKVDLYIDAGSRRSLGDDEYWPDELVGLEVRDESGVVLGTVSEVDETAPQARLVIATLSGQRLVPLVSELVPEIRQREGFLVLRVLPGLLDDEVD